MARAPLYKRSFLNRVKYNTIDRFAALQRVRRTVAGPAPRPSTDSAFLSVLLPQCNDFAVVARLHGVIDYFFIHSFIKYLLNTHCDLGVGLSPGITGRVRQVLSPRDPDSKEHSREGPTPTRWQCLEGPSAGRTQPEDLWRAFGRGGDGVLRLGGGVVGLEGRLGLRCWPCLRLGFPRTAARADIALTPAPGLCGSAAACQRRAAGHKLQVGGRRPTWGCVTADSGEAGGSTVQGRTGWG